jgi:transglutaminase-like putative cysteine protease
MKSRLFYPATHPRRKTRLLRRSSFLLRVLSTFAAGAFLGILPARAADAPSWMHAQVNVPLPAHDDKTDAVLLYSETILTVESNGKIKSLEREAYKILRPDGKSRGMVRVDFDSETRINSIHAWCIPAQGKDYEVKDKDGVETALLGVQNGELMSDIRTKILEIPAAIPGNIVGYEIEREERPYVMQEEWVVQETIPVRESHYTLRLPPGWEYKAVWINHPEVAPTSSRSGQTEWAVADVKAIKPEGDMPPWRGVASTMLISLLPPGAAPNRGFLTWADMGNWYLGLTRGRRDASPEIKQKVAALTASATTPLSKMRALASFVQNDIRYVAIELGIGGHQPHPAADIFAKRYGDCKDKATLLSSMLKEIGVDSYYVVINTERGSVTPSTPPNPAFNHVILAVQLPAGPRDPSLVAVWDHPKLGQILFFDPTDDLTPFGQLRGELQANYGLLVTPDGGELVELPQLATALNAIQRTAKLSIDEKGALQGEVHEVRLGDAAMRQRYALRTVTKDTDQIKPIETLLSHAFATYHINKASVANLHVNDLPFEYHYSIAAENYAKLTGNLLLVRPRVLGTKSSGLLETKEARLYPVNFEGPQRDTDVFEIDIPPAFEVDDLPPPVNADYGFAAYQSKTEMVGHILRYTRTFEIKQLSVPADKADELKKFYRIITNDERNSAVFKPGAQ